MDIWSEMYNILVVDDESGIRSIIRKYSEFEGHKVIEATDGMMAVTDYIDDEKPLYVGVDSEMNITGFHDQRQPDSRYISGGIYCLRSSALHTLHRCMEQGQSRMRNFQRGLIEDRLNLKACPLSKILDVDHASDIEKAEAFLRECNR